PWRTPAPHAAHSAAAAIPAVSHRRARDLLPYSHKRKLRHIAAHLNNLSALLRRMLRHCCSFRVGFRSVSNKSDAISKPCYCCLLSGTEGAGAGNNFPVADGPAEIGGTLRRDSTPQGCRAGFGGSTSKAEGQLWAERQCEKTSSACPCRLPNRRPPAQHPVFFAASPLPGARSIFMCCSGPSSASARSGTISASRFSGCCCPRC